MTVRRFAASVTSAIAPEFVHYSPLSKVVFRPGAIADLGPELARLGVRRPFLVASHTAGRSPIHARVIDALQGRDVAGFTDVPAHSSVGAVEQVLARARAHRADAFLAVGGGSASDTAKAASLWLAEGGRLEDHASRFTPPQSLQVPELRAPKLPIIAVPCTASGAEVTPSLGIRADDGRKLLFWDPKVASRLIVIDPETNASVPAPLMLATGMNGLAHCIEGLYSRIRTPVTTALALHAIALFGRALPCVARAPESVACRAELLAAAHLSGLVLVNARTCLHHAICHALGAMTGVAHGQANAVMLPHAMEFNSEAAQEALESVALAWPNRDGWGGRTAIDLVRALQQEIEVPTRLRDIGVPRELLHAVAVKAMSERGLFYNPRRVESPRDIEALLEQAW
jgi:alcohol dehydrogenase